MQGKVLAIDYGTRRVGLASGDLEHKIAFPRAVLNNKGNRVLAEAVIEVCEEIGVKIVVIGLPLNMEADHKENKVMKSVRSFVDLLEEMVVAKFGAGELEIVLFDERLSTFEAEQMMEGFDSNERMDDKAAQVILQRWFDGLE